MGWVTLGLIVISFIGMKVLLINHFPLEGSGSGTYTRDVAAFLIKGGHQVSLVFPENVVPQELPGAQVCPVFCGQGNGLACALPFNFPCFTTHPRSTTTFADLRADELAQYLEVFDSAITEEIETFKPDIIHVQHIWFLSYLACKHGLPCVITAHGTDLMGHEKWPEFRSYAEEAVERCDRIITISKDNYQATMALYPQARDKTVLLSNGYNNDIFYPQPVDRHSLLAHYELPDLGQRIILFAGKMTAFKGLDVLLHAAQRYEAAQPGAFMTVIAGSGQEEENLHRLAKELGLESVHFIGHQDQASLRRLYSTADVFVMPSRSEAFGLVALEAMACGLPVVASRVGGLPDFVNSEVGTLAEGGNPDSLAQAILAELRNISLDPQRKTKVAQYALEHYSMTHYISQLEEIYRSVISG